MTRSQQSSGVRSLNAPCDTSASQEGISSHLVTHSRASKNRSGDAPAPANRSVTVAWAVSVVLHVVLLAFVADRPWFFRLEVRASERLGDVPVRERIEFLSVATPDVPTMRRMASTSRAERRLSATARSTAIDVGTPTDSVAGGLPASITTSPSGSAPILNTPFRRRAWLSPSQLIEIEVRGESVPFNQLRTGLRAAIAAAADSIKRAKEQERASADWTLKLGGGARLGVSPMRLHLGLFEVPVPVKVVSIRDFDPQLRARQRMLDDVREQSDRALRDSIVTESISAIRSRSKERARSPQ